MKKQIIEAIKNFDTHALKQLLDDTKSYMNVSKAQFIGALESEFEEAKKEGCFAFDDVFFGICGSCNKGCEGMTFYSNTGYFLDLFIESDSEGDVKDMYICNQLSNFTDLKKSFDLSFHFCKDQEVNFKPSKEYLQIKSLFEDFKIALSRFEDGVPLDKLVACLEDYNYLEKFITDLGPFAWMGVKLYEQVSESVYDIKRVALLKSQAEHAIEALIDYQKIASERDSVLWYFEKESDAYRLIGFTKTEKPHIISYSSDSLKIDIDISGYEYVVDYFYKIDALYNELMKKYKPLPEHYKAGRIEDSLERFLELHNKYLDIVEWFRKNSNNL
ncbi:hypothetical protein [Bizionia paragorgiae]|uniref:Uncharacterized protein n=1 Tax=Bizionia paragorgiae TaxID=283786 RepID=A0A1H3X044_BIZPA|nr:hypothetical protein [Bizionia paragorgiae]SDZ92766.1 hypothetical protein SAMN04487990_10488 [Bizionia paragorgiae]